MSGSRVARPVLLALAVAALSTGAPAATQVHVVDQWYTPAAANSVPGIQILDIPIPTGGGRNAQGFVPVLDNVTFAYVWGNEGLMPGVLTVRTPEGTVLGTASLSGPASQPDGLRRAFFAAPVPVTPGGGYTLDFDWSLPANDVVSPVAYRLQGGSPGGYPFANAVLQGTPDPRVDFFFVEGGLARQLPQTGAAPQAPGSVRVALHSDLLNSATLSQWELGAVGGATWLLTGDHEGSFLTGFDPATGKTATKFELALPDDGDGYVDNRRLGVSILDRVTLHNAGDEIRSVSVRGSFDASATFAAGSAIRPSVTQFLSVDGTHVSGADGYARGESADVLQALSPIVIDVPANATISFDVHHDLIILAPEGSTITSLNSFTLAYDLPDGVTMTSMFAAAPVPEPRSVALMAAGIALLGWRLRRRA